MIDKNDETCKNTKEIGKFRKLGRKNEKADEKVEKKVDERENERKEEREEKNLQRNALIDVCKDILDKDKIRLILAFSDREVDGGAAPFFIRDKEEIEKMKWDSYCTPNLAKYILESSDKGNYKIGIVAKPCDARALVMYMVEKQIKREDVYIIGMECRGMKDNDGSLSPGCDECSIKIPPIYDILIKTSGEVSYPHEEKGLGTSTDEEKGIENLQSCVPATQEERLERFTKEINKCILCYSCRQVCYACYCPTCFIDRTAPDWSLNNVDSGAKILFHLGRAMHLAGRCIECGACERACASGVKIRYLIKEITDFSKEIYGYTAGMDPEQASLLSHFNKDDKEIGFLGGEEI